MKKFILFLGAPGSGKGTQSKLLSKRCAIAHVAMGDLVRDAIKSGSALGKEVARYSKLGQLVPDQVIFDIFDQSVGSRYLSSGFILDGFPRTGAQAEFVCSFFKKHNIDIARQVAIIHLSVPLSHIKRRILGRRVCPECGALYNIYYSPPSVEDTCDACGHVGLTVREDDTEAIIETRFAEFEKTHNAVLSVFGSSVVDIDGLLPSSEVFDQILSSIEADQSK